MECSGCRDMFSSYYDGELEGPRAAQFIEHLRTCADCKREFAKYTESLAALKGLAGELDVHGVALSVRKAVSSSCVSRAARWRQIVVNDMRVVSEMLRPARGGLIFLATAAAAVLFVIILTYTLTMPREAPPVSPAADSVRQQTPKRASVLTAEALQKDMVRINGDWMTKDEALALMLGEKGLGRHGDWILPEEDARRMDMGLLPHENTWLTPEEIARRLQDNGTGAPAVAEVEPEKAEPAVKPTPERLERMKQPLAKKPEQPPPPKTRRIDVRERPVADNGVAAFLSTVLPDEMESHEGLTVCSLTRQEREWEGKGNFYVTLADAVERDLAEIRETGKVNRLLIKKDSSVAIVAIGGGILIGGWQNRLIGPDIYLSADTTEARIDVYCAEQGRWSGSKTFSLAGYLAVADLRKKSYNGEEQDYIWKSIKDLKKSQKVYSVSKSIHKLYEKRTIKKQTALIEKAFGGLKDKLINKPHTIGIVALVDGKIIGADLFVNNDLLMQYFDQLVRTYAVDTIMVRDEKKSPPAQEQVCESVGEFIATAARSSYSSTGDETYLEYRITDSQSDLFGYALSTSNVPVHISLFADSTGLKEQKAVSRHPKAVKKAGDDQAGKPSTTKKKKISLEEAAAAKLRKEGKIKPRTPLPPSPPSPPSPPAPKNAPPKSRFFQPRLHGR